MDDGDGLLVLSHANDAAVNCSLWAGVFLASLRRAVRGLNVTTVLSSHVELSSLQSAYTSSGFALRVRRLNTLSPLQIWRDELARNHPLHVMVVSRFVGTIFQLPLRAFLPKVPAAGSAAEVLASAAHAATNGVTQRGGSLVIAYWEQGMARGRSIAVRTRVGRHAGAGQTSSTAVALSWAGRRCSEAPLNAFYELVDANGAPTALAFDLHVGQCAWTEVLLRALRPVTARTVGLSSPKSLRKWRSELASSSWDGRVSESKALSVRWPNLFAPPHASPPARCEAASRQIMLTISSYVDPTPLYRWLRSLRDAGATCDVGVFTDDVSNRAARAVAARYDARLLRFVPSLPGVDPELMSRFSNQMIKNYKFAILGQWAEREGRAYERVGFVDVRDAYFQRDPFAAVPCVGLSAFTETAAVKLRARAAIHRDHYERRCGTGFDQMAQWPPVNSGVFIGERRAFVALMHRCHAKVARCGKGYDQGTFTEVIYEPHYQQEREARVDPAAIAPVGVRGRLQTTEHGPVAHLSLSRALSVNHAGEALNENGVAYAIVHQYDRFAGLEARLRDRLPLDPSLSPLHVNVSEARRARDYDLRSTTAPRLGKSKASKRGVRARGVQKG